MTSVFGTTKLRSTGYSFQDDFEKSRKRFNIMFRLVACFIGLVFIASIAWTIWFFASGASISYSVDYQVGGVQYEESYSYNTNR